MQDYIELGSSPCEESCAQVGSADYEMRSRKECRVYADQLRRMFPNVACDIRTKYFRHDFGTYAEVCAVYWDDNEQSIEDAFRVESELPACWDEEAKRKLG